MADAPRKPTGFHVFCDETDTDSGKRYMVYGGIIVASENLPKVEQQIANWRITHRMMSELKWTKVSNGKYAEYESLVDLFFWMASTRRILHFKAIILDTYAPEYQTFSEGSAELGFYKFYYHFLLKYFAKFAVNNDCWLDIVIDERDYSVELGDPLKALHVILNNGIKKEFGIADGLVTSVEPRKSHSSDVMQLADVLMGAVGFHNNDRHLRPSARQAKLKLAAYIGRRGGRRDLKQETAYTKEFFKIARWFWPSTPRKKRPTGRRGPW